MPALVEKTAERFPLRDVSADKAYPLAREPQARRQQGRDGLHPVQVEQPGQGLEAVAADVPSLQP